MNDHNSVCTSVTALRPGPAAPRSARPRPVGSRPADLPRYGNWGEKGLGFFHLGTGFWLFYLMFAAVLNFTLKYTLPL
jgi:hypothetical protein